MTYLAHTTSVQWIPLIERLLENPHAHKWTVQGLGMVRVKLLEEYRLHIWTPEAFYAGTSEKHTHPWDFESVCHSGMIRNVRYVEAEGGTPYMRQTIECGESGCVMADPVEVFLQQSEINWIYPGKSYRMPKDEIHASVPEPGTVSVIRRIPNPGKDIANVYYPKGDTWTSAAARPATEDEVNAAVLLATRNWRPYF